MLSIIVSPLWARQSQAASLILSAPIGELLQVTSKSFVLVRGVVFVRPRT